MSKMSKSDKMNLGLVPKLRFPEFAKTGEWEVTTLGEVTSYKKGFAFNSKDFTSSGISIIKISDTQGATIKDNLESYIDINLLSNMDNLTDLKEDDVIITTVGSKPPMYNSMVGRCIVVSSKYGGALLNQNLVRLRGQEKVLNQKFLSAMLGTRKFTTFVESIIRGNANQGSISLNDLFKFKDCIPFLPEQEKISDCLSSLDDIISLEDKKHTSLKEHKKGLMQKLFPAEGKTVPELRFKEFQNSPNWEECTFSDLAIFHNGRAYKQDELLSSGKYRVLRVGNFFSNNVWYYSDLELDENKYCENGDLLYAWSASFGPRIWHSEKVIYHYHIWKVCHSKNIDKSFLYILLDKETHKMKSQSANGMGLMHITKGTIEKWECYTPRSKPEQEKIAECLSSLDDLISAQAEKIGALKIHKKYLMQNLFPAMSEVN